MAILNYTTTINANKSVGEIQALLASKGARKVMIEYGPCAEVAAISFEILCNEIHMQFRLPANWKGVHKAILKAKIKGKPVAAKYRGEQHAIGVCWRIIKDWIEAQLAIIEAEQADMATVFLPYAIMKDGNTVSENFLHKNEGKQFLLNAANQQ